MDDLELIMEKIKFLENQLISLKKRVERYEKNNVNCKMNQEEKLATQSFLNIDRDFNPISILPPIDLKAMRIDPDNKEKYIEWFVKYVGHNKKTAQRHIEQLNAWKKRLVEDMKLAIEGDIFLFDDPILFNKLIEYFQSNQEMLIKNAEKHHYYYSAAYNWFNKFLHWKYPNA